MGKIDGGLRSLFRQNLPHFDWTSIETGGTGRGVPDSNYCYHGTEGWIEYKQTIGHAVTLMPEQIGWIARRCRAGGRVFIAVRQRAAAGPRREQRDILWLIPGCDAVIAKTGGLKNEAPTWQQYHNGPTNWDWREIANHLTDNRANRVILIPRQKSRASPR